MRTKTSDDEMGAEDPAGVDRKFVSALARGLDVLRAFRPSHPALSNQEIADIARLPRPTVTRLTYTLETLGFLSYDEAIRKYRLAPAAIAIGYTAMASSAVRSVAQPLMQQMADEVGISVALGVRDRLSMIYIAHCAARSAMVVQLVEGSRIPIATTAMGRAYLAALDDPQRAVVLAEIRQRAGAQKWPKLRDGIEAGRRDHAQLGFTASIQDWHEDVNGVSVPFVARDGTGIYAFNCGGPSILCSQERMRDEVGPRLVRLVSNVEAQLHGGLGEGGASRPPRGAATAARALANQQKQGVR